MNGDVKGMVPAAGNWLAVYASDTGRGLRTQPVLFWIMTEDPDDDRAAFVGVVEFGPHLITADDPYLLGYAHKGENLRKKFGAALRQFRREEAASDGGDPAEERSALAELLRAQVAIVVDPGTVN